MIKKSLGLVIILSGLMVFLYPRMSHLINLHNSTKVIAAYTKQVKDLRPAQYCQAIRKARQYNRQLDRHKLAMNTRVWQKKYARLLNVCGNSLMGYVEVEKVNIRLPIYHGTAPAVLEIGAGHLEYSSLPVGGRNTHSVIVAHSGLPSAKMFDDLTRLKKGDQFTIHVLNRTLIYSIDDIKTVKPAEVEAVKIVKDQDLVTLMTCTPIGINNRRLLVRGHRVKRHKKEKQSGTMRNGDRILCVLLLIILLAIIKIEVMRYRQKNSISHLYCDHDDHRSAALR